MPVCVLDNMVQRGMKNPNLNGQILQELDDLENFSGRKYILREREFLKGILWWKKKAYSYCLYLEIQEGLEYQILTATEGDGSQVLAFLLGSNSYYERNKQEEMNANKLFYQLPKAVRFWDNVYTLNPNLTTISQSRVEIIFQR